MNHTDLTQTLRRAIRSPFLHARWLNTLSLMENCGARKISASEDVVQVKLEVLKHAAEEARHAFFLKSMAQRTDPGASSTYEDALLLAPRQSRRYLDALDLRVCRYLKEELGFHGQRLKDAAYLLVTYAIERRADEIYPAYQRALDSEGISINLQMILAEESQHLAEMKEMLQEVFKKDWEIHARRACALEDLLFTAWKQAVESEIMLDSRNGCRISGEV